MRLFLPTRSDQYKAGPLDVALTSIASARKSGDKSNSMTNAPMASKTPLCPIHVEFPIPRLALRWDPGISSKDRVPIAVATHDFFPRSKSSTAANDCNHRRNAGQTSTPDWAGICTFLRGPIDLLMADRSRSQIQPHLLK